MNRRAFLFAASASPVALVAPAIAATPVKREVVATLVVDEDVLRGAIEAELATAIQIARQQSQIRVIQHFGPIGVAAQEAEQQMLREFRSSSGTRP